MVDIEKQIAYWRNGAVEDWEVATHLLERGNVRHGLFFVHLAVEKALKALVCRNTDDLAPKDHNLIRLLEKAGLNLTPQHRGILVEVNTFNIEGRYPESRLPQYTPAEARSAVRRAEEVFRWLIGQS
jgi:HEPN domain-containing protein